MSLVNDIIPGIDRYLPLLDPELWLYLPDMQCNFKCSYCYMNRSGRPRGCNLHSDKFRLPENLSAIKRWIILYGGEPLTDKVLLRKLIVEIRRYTNAPITFSTNGSLLTYSDVSFFKKNNVKISVSYDGPFQKYRTFDIFKKKHNRNILYKAYKHGVFCWLNTVVHRISYPDYKFDLPKIDVIHDYNYIYPIKTETNEAFLFDESYADNIAERVAFEVKSMLLQIKSLSVERIVHKYPPYIFSLLNGLLNLHSKLNIQKLDPDKSMCKQTHCKHLDIYGNFICGKGYETNVLKAPKLGAICAQCRYSPICSYKCPANTFDRSICKNMYMYKVYNKVDLLLQSIL